VDELGKKKKKLKKRPKPEPLEKNPPLLEMEILRNE
jgi:hypothetical protein